MKLYDYKMAPNPRRVRMFLVEKGITDIEKVDIDLGKGETYSKEFRAINPYGGLPVLELDSGEYVAESMAICRYFEEIEPNNPMMGSTPEEKARIEMWNRRVELQLYSPIASTFQNSNPFWAKVVKQVPQYAEVSIEKVDKMLHMLNKRCAESEYIAGNEFSVADITALCAIDFAKVIQRRVDAETHPHLAEWHAKVSQRPSAQV